MIMVKAGDTPLARNRDARSAMPTRTARAIARPSMIFAVMRYGLSDLIELRHRLQETELDLVPVARRQHALDLFLPDLGLDEHRAFAGMQKPPRRGELAFLRDGARFGKAASLGNADHVDAILRMARL